MVESLFNQTKCVSGIFQNCCTVDPKKTWSQRPRSFPTIKGSMFAPSKKCPNDSTLTDCMDRMDSTDGTDRTIVGRIDTMDRMDKADETDRMDKMDKTDRTNRTNRTNGADFARDSSQMES